MGLFDRFKKKENTNNYTIPERKPYDLRTQVLNDGSRFYEFEDHVYHGYIDEQGQNRDSKGYDTTRLVVQSQTILGNRVVYNCLISWYNQSDTVFFGEGGTYSRAEDYKAIAVELDLNLLENNPDYLCVLMRDLLDQSRVTSHLTESLEDKRRCGNYMGLVAQNQNQQFQKYTHPDAELASHNSSPMIAQRRQYMQEQASKRQAQIRSKQAEIARLQADIDSLSYDNNDGR